MQLKNYDPVDERCLTSLSDSPRSILRWLVTHVKRSDIVALTAVKDVTPHRDISPVVGGDALLLTMS